MSSISPIIKHIESFIVTGLSTRTQNCDEFNQETAKIPTLWHQFYTSDLAANTSIFSVYSNYDSGVNGHYTVTVGSASDDARDQFSSTIIQAGNYLVFQNKGPMPDIVIELWKQIWSYFETHSEYQRNFISDFEAYSGSDQVTIYIGVNN